MIYIILTLVFFSVLSLILGVTTALRPEDKPTLERILGLNRREKKKANFFRSLSRVFTIFNKPLCAGTLGERLGKDLALARVNLFPEEFLFVKELVIVLLLALTYPHRDPENPLLLPVVMIAVGWFIPEFLLKRRITKIKDQLIKALPDTIDLLALCVNAGLDFLLSLKWVIDKSTPSVLTLELNHVLQEVNVGKPRRDALIDFANKYQIPDLSTFTRALVQADRMGTSVADAMNIISEDMRVSRFRRGEQAALKAPLKMLIPLLFFIFPVVGILIAGPIFLQFLQGNPLSGLGR